MGWHVPSDAEWFILENYLKANGYNYDGSTTGNKYAKAMADTILWNSDTGVGTVGHTDYPTYRNKSGFSGLPGGYRNYNGDYYSIGDYGDWWSSSQYNANYAWARNLNYSTINLTRGYHGGIKGYGFSVRCLRD